MRITMWVGLTIPGRFTANWPLVGLRLHDAGFEVVALRPVRRLLALATARDPRGVVDETGRIACSWTDVVAVRRIRRGVELSVGHGRAVRLLTLAPGRTATVLNACASAGVRSAR